MTVQFSPFGPSTFGFHTLDRTPSPQPRFHHIPEFLSTISWVVIVAIRRVSRLFSEMQLVDNLKNQRIVKMNK